MARYGQRDFPRLVERIRQQKADGYTALYDAIGVYLDGASGQDGRKILLLYTDGGDTRSAMRLQRAARPAEGVRRHGLRDRLPRAPVRSPAGSEQRLRLQQIAEATGGQAFFPTSVKDLDAVYEQVLAEIRAQYTLGYLSTNEQTDGAWRKVEIKVTRPAPSDYRVRSRQGYFAPVHTGTLRPCRALGSGNPPALSRQAAASGTMSSSDALRATTASSSSPTSSWPATSRAPSAS